MSNFLVQTMSNNTDVSAEFERNAIELQKKKREKAMLRKKLEEETVVRARLFEEAEAAAAPARDALAKVIHQRENRDYYDVLIDRMQKLNPLCEAASQYQGPSPNVPTYEKNLVTVQQQIDELERWFEQEEDLPSAKKAKTSSTFVQN